MPAYDYGCSQCGLVFEVCHGMNDRPEVCCPECGHVGAKRRFTVISIGHGACISKGRVQDHLRVREDMVTDLRENHGVEKLVPLRGNTLRTVYNEVKASGGKVREEMARSTEDGAKKRDTKRKQWLREAQKRVPMRNQQVAERRKKEEAVKRRISL